MSDKTAPSSKRRRSEPEPEQDEQPRRSKSEYKKSKSSRFIIPSDSLKWTGPVAGFDDGGGMMMFEELEGVDVQWEEGLNGQKTAKFLVCPLYCLLDR
jgi:hypothetical protein